MSHAVETETVMGTIGHLVVYSDPPGGYLDTLARDSWSTIAEYFYPPLAS